MEQTTPEYQNGELPVKRTSIIEMMMIPNAPMPSDQVDLNGSIPTIPQDKSQIHPSQFNLDNRNSFGLPGKLLQDHPESIKIPRVSPRKDLPMPRETQLGCWQKFGQMLGMKDQGPQQIYQIQVQVRDLQIQIDLEKQQKNVLKFELKQLEQTIAHQEQVQSQQRLVEQFKSPQVTQFSMQEKEKTIESNREIVIKDDDEDEQMDFSNIVFQQVVSQEIQNLKSERNHVMDTTGGFNQPSASHRVIPTERDATARRVALNGNLSFDQPQASNSTGRSTGNEHDQGTKVEQSFAFDRQVSFNDATKRAPGKPQMIQDGQTINIDHYYNLSYRQ